MELLNGLFGNNLILGNNQNICLRKTWKPHNQFRICGRGTQHERRFGFLPRRKTCRSSASHCLNQASWWTFEVYDVSEDCCTHPNLLVFYWHMTYNFGHLHLQRATKVLLSCSIFITLPFTKETCKINLKLDPCISEVHIAYNLLYIPLHTPIRS